ncbi:F1892 protein, partial [Eubucco bourcierii]|nr:F1892 protein [Eubucco bourcierii]
PRHSAPGAGWPSVQTLALLALMQVIVGCAIVLLNFGVLLLSSSSQLKNACPFWASSLIILCGILGIVIWKKPVMILANLFVLLSVVCVLLNSTAFILEYQGIHFVSRVPRCDLVEVGESRICFCCEEFQPTKCREESVLKLYHVKSCGFALVRLKKLLLALCVLSVFATVVSFSVAVLSLSQMVTPRTSYLVSRYKASPAANDDHVLNPEDFTSAVPPPSYFTAVFSRTPPMSCRVFGPNTVPLVCNYRAEMGGAEVFDEPPPPYEAVQSQTNSEQVCGRQTSQDLCYSGNFSNNCILYYSNKEISESSSSVSFLLSNASLVSAGVGRRSFHPLKKWSKSDPVLHCQLLQEAMLCLESERESEGNAPLHAVTPQSSLRGRALSGRPRSLDLTDTKWLVAWFTEQSCGMGFDLCGLVENIKSAGKHTAQAASSPSFLEQVMGPRQEAMLLDAPGLPFRWQPCLHLERHDDLHTCTTNEDQLAERRIQEAEHE